MCPPRGTPDGSQQRSTTGTAARSGSAALQIVGDVANYISQGQQYRRNAAATRRDFERTSEALGIRAIQVQESTAESVLDIALQGARARASAKVSGASSGLSGATVRAMSQGVDVAEGTARTRTLANEQNQLDQISRELDATQINAQRRIDSVSRGSPLNLALQIGSSIVDVATLGV